MSDEFSSRIAARRLDTTDDGRNASSVWLPNPCTANGCRLLSVIPDREENDIDEEQDEKRRVYYCADTIEVYNVVDKNKHATYRYINKLSVAV